MTSKTYLAVAILFVALIIGGVLAWPKYQDLRYLQTEVELKEAELSSRTDYFGHIKTAAQGLEEYQEVLGKISSALPPEPGLPSTFNFLQKTASQTGLVLEDITMGSIGILNKAKSNQESSQAVKVVNLGATLTGSYTAFKDFLSEVESSARIIEVKQISYASPEEEEGGELFTFGINFTVHSY